MTNLRALKDICVLITDGTHYTPKDIGIGVLFLTVKDMTYDGLDFSNCSKISRDDYLIAKNGNSAPQYGDVLFSKDGTVGKVQLVDSRNEFAVLSSIAILRPDPTKLSANYLAHVLKSKNTLNDAVKKKTGSAIRRIILSDLKTIQIPLPPLAEQQRIAALLDTADNILRLRQQAIAKLNQLAQSVFLEMFGDCNNWIALKNVIVRNRIKEQVVDEKVWSLSLEQIASETGDLIEKIMVEKNELGSSTFYFQPPVVLYSKLRPYLNKVFMPKENGYATTELIPLYCDKEKILPEYLLTILRSKKFVNFANTNSGGAKMPRVSMDKFWEFEVPLASIDKQKQFLKIFDHIEIEKQNHVKTFIKYEHLISSLQYQSFAVN